MKFFHKFCLWVMALSLSYSVQSQSFNGYALYNTLNSQTTYLIDKDGDIAHTWSNNRPCNYAVLLMPTGNIMRGYVNQSNVINGAAVGGGVQEIDPQGNIVWDFPYSTADYVSHHDICLMPNGNVLLIAWEVKTNAELSAYGYTGTSNQKYPTHLVEVSQNGTGGEIVWEWHILDHMVQDVDSTLSNYGVISEHPELMNINIPVSSGGGPGGGGPGGGGGDWFHVNGVDYNAELDQIAFSSRFLSEIYIIDHSTTTAEAAGHTGGNAGKGGDFLYRWGNPDNYDMPGASQIASAVHDARWVPDDGRPRGGYLQFFNNSGDSNNGSKVDAIKLPFAADGYNYERVAGAAYGPDAPTYRHDCIDDASGQSSAISMPNGNMFVNLSREFMYEADTMGNVIWQHNEGPAKAFRYTCDDPGIQVLISTGVIEDLCSSVDTKEAFLPAFTIAPNPSKGLFTLSGMTADYQVQEIQVFDTSLRKIRTVHNANTVDLSDQTAGAYFATVHFENGKSLTRKLIVE